MKENQQLSSCVPSGKYEVGKIIGDLEIIEKIPNKTTRKCKCLKCGHIYEVPISTLRSREKAGTPGCAKCWQKPVHSDQYKYHSGDIIGSYKLIECIGHQEGKWKAVCTKCGKEQIIRISNARKRVSDGCSYCSGHVGQRVPNSGQQNIIKHITYSLDELSYREYKSKITGFNQHSGRKYKEFKLTLDDWTSLIHSNCHYCGAEPNSNNQYHNRRKTNPEPFYMNGIDRIDPNQGYTLENCVPCCSICNRMKWDLPYNEWINHMHQILKYTRESSTTIPAGSTSQANGDGNGGFLNSEEKGNDIV